MRAFIIRPFGTKSDGAGSQIDFDAVEARLIAPALREIGVQGRTTAEIVSSGNIREDVFRRLVSADLVVADISLPNPNVYYELGIRHALRDRRTFLIRCDDVREPPFDLLTDRYFPYPRARPDDALADLVHALEATLASERCDSPVHHLVPGVATSDPELVVEPPSSFVEELRRARVGEDRARLALLADELVGLPFERRGLRMVAAAQRGLGDYREALHTWRAVRQARPDDVQANTEIADVCHRLGKLDESELALDRAMEAAEGDSLATARLHALRARNEAHRWRDAWRAASPEQRPSSALRSTRLRHALDAYETAFACDLNFTYAAQRSLCLRSVLVHLASARPAEWSGLHVTQEEASDQLEAHRRDLSELAVAVKRSVRAALERERDSEDSSGWAALSWAEYHCLTLRRPDYVATLYRRAVERAEPCVRDSAVRQLGLLHELGIAPENVAAAFDAVQGGLRTNQEETRVSGSRSFPARVIVFAGHRVDTERLLQTRGARLPESQIDAARVRIRAAVEAEEQHVIGPMVGVGALTAGGDLLFHEVVRELGYPSLIRLPFPPRLYQHTALQDAGPHWVERFRRLARDADVKVLGDTDRLPDWQVTKPDYGIRRRANLWMLYEALAIENADVTLVALWNGEEDHLPGGVDDMVRKARLHGAKVVHIDTRSLASEPAP